MTVINGASTHNVDDLLQTIRTSLGDESSARPLNGELQVPYTRRDIPLADEVSEFELPAIFKPGHHMQSEKPKLFGRLSDALKTPPADPDRSRTVIRFEPANGRMMEPPQAVRPAQASGPEHATASQPDQAAQSSQGPSDPTVKRQMPSFFDQRLNKLGEMTRDAYSPKPEPKPAAPMPQAAPPPLRPQMQDPTQAAQHAQNLEVEDAAAQLLRPMLRQWLSENMPKIVEKALLSEVEGQLKPPGRK
jgi:cell pole-organizing protein PopZ